MPKRKSSPKKTQTKTQFVLAQDPKLSAVEIVKLGKAAGLTFSPQLVHNVRWTAKRNASSKSSPAASTSKSKKVTSARPAAAKPATHVAQPSANKTTGAIAGISALDLAYAVGRLVAAGKTSIAEVSGLARERVARITTLETQLAALKHGAVPPGDVNKSAASAKRPSKPSPAKKHSAKPSAPKSAASAKPAAKPAVAKAPAAKPAAAKPAVSSAKPAVAAKPAVTAAKPAVVAVKPVAATPPVSKPAAAKPAVSKPAAKPPVAKPAAAAKPVAKSGGSKPTSAGHAFTMTPKALAARQVQAQYMGALRVMPEIEKAKYKALAKEKGVATALAEIKKRGTK